MSPLANAEVITYYWLHGTDGNKYTGHNFPHHVKWTGEKTIRGVAIKSGNANLGPMFRTKQEAEDQLTEWKKE